MNLSINQSMSCSFLLIDVNLYHGSEVLIVRSKAATGSCRLNP